MLLNKITARPDGNSNNPKDIRILSPIHISRRNMVNEGVIVVYAIKVPVGYALYGFWVLYHD
jgi:hypothetical protein